jgi:septal ring factor EnvC (AmiA/AmiB activator)
LLKPSLRQTQGGPRERLSRHLGAAADAARDESLSPLLEQLEQRTAELEADNHHQRQRINQLEAEAREFADTLEAARAMNRELMTELNRRAGTSATKARSRTRR